MFPVCLEPANTPVDMLPLSTDQVKHSSLWTEWERAQFCDNVITARFRGSLCCKWNESGFRPPLCTYRLNWARRTSWGWWDDWDDTVLQTQDSKFEPWRSEAEHATSRSRRLPTILTFTHGWGRNIFVSFKPPRPGTEPRTLAWKAAVLTTTLGPPPFSFKWCIRPQYDFCAAAWHILPQRWCNV